MKRKGTKIFNGKIFQFFEEKDIHKHKIFQNEFLVSSKIYENI